MDHMCDHIMNLLTNRLPNGSLKSACRNSSFLSLLQVRRTLSGKTISITSEKPPGDSAKVGHGLNQEVVTFLLEFAKMSQDLSHTALEPLEPDLLWMQLPAAKI